VQSRGDTRVEVLHGHLGERAEIEPLAVLDAQEFELEPGERREIHRFGPFELQPAQVLNAPLW
jgi:hypothetical protein